ncbi:lipopolysaccharide biosynthesis protein [Kitasatospora sp. NPDC093550]|uniref:lipopolysaccharide biosynthesis protein n=1 Tax=Kitasatospora sp. NPDC093550 TaxID=3364089 RepID=UPI00381EC049
MSAPTTATGPAGSTATGSTATGSTATAPARGRPCSCPLPLPCECSYATLLRARLRAATAGEPLLRNGHVLTASSILTAGFGAVFWMLATRWYGAQYVGLAYAVLSAAMLLSEVGQLNLADVLVRFLPTAGRRTRGLLVRCYLVATAADVLVGAVFIGLVPVVAPGLGFLRSPPAAVAFVALTAGYTLFVLQDGALTGLRRPGWVLGENALFAAVKLVLLAALAGWALHTGIVLAWSGALLVALVVANLLLFRRLLPAVTAPQVTAPQVTAPQVTGPQVTGPQAAVPQVTGPRVTGPPAPGGTGGTGGTSGSEGPGGGTGSPEVPRLARYATADYLGALLRLAAATVVPLYVLDTLGPEQSAYYSLPWVIAYTFHLIALNMGSSLIVEAARAPGRLAEHGLRVLRHTGALVAAGVLVTVVAAPWLLSRFGAEYADHGTAVLRLLALAALPNLLVSLAVDAARARQRLGLIVGLQGVYCALVLGLTAWLLPRLGLVGAGLAWLIAATAVAVPLLCTLPRWLPTPERRRP